MLVLDYTRYPHILDNILYHVDSSQTLKALRLTSREICGKIDRVLLKTLLLHFSSGRWTLDSLEWHTFTTWLKIDFLQATKRSLRSSREVGFTVANLQRYTKVLRLEIIPDGRLPNGGYPRLACYERIPYAFPSADVVRIPVPLCFIKQLQQRSMRAKQRR